MESKPRGRPAVLAMRFGRILILPMVGAGIWFARVAVAQEAPSASSLEMRHFWHVFVAYAVAWVILFGWMLSILRRIRRVEDRLGAEEGGGPGTGAS